MPPEMRYNPITLDWVIMAPEREHRPNDFPTEAPHREARVSHRDDCPFCVGNEHLAPPEIRRASAADGSWTVRVIPNKFSVFTNTDNLNRRSNSTFRSMVAAGSHEVVVEHPDHGLALEDMTPSHLAVILNIFRERYQALRKNPAVESIVIFKNHGQRAGSSLTHSHSQITAAPVLSSQVWMRLQEARRHHELNGGCLYCQVMEDELRAQERLIEAGDSFVAFAPYASLSPYHTWIFPRRHASSFDSISDADIIALAGALSRVVRRLAKAAGGPDYNFTIRSAPVTECDTQYFHWYLAIVPRMNQLAGFELGSGTYINNLWPERCADLMRKAELES